MLVPRKALTPADDSRLEGGATAGSGVFGVTTGAGADEVGLGLDLGLGAVVDEAITVEGVAAGAEGDIL